MTYVVTGSFDHNKNLLESHTAVALFPLKTFPFNHLREVVFSEIKYEIIKHTIRVYKVNVTEQLYIYNMLSGTF